MNLVDSVESDLRPAASLRLAGAPVPAQSPLNLPQREGWRWFVWVHVPLILWAASIPFVSYPCPFTDWEKSLRAAAALPVYQGHFLQHYVYEPLAPYGGTSSPHIRRYRT